MEAFNDFNDTNESNVSSNFTTTLTTTAASNLSINLTAGVASSAGNVTVTPPQVWKNDATWDDAFKHALVAFLCWVGLFGMTYAAAALRKHWVTPSRLEIVEMAKYQLATQKYYLFSQMGLLIGCCVVHVLRVEHYELDSSWTFMEIAAVSLYTIEVFFVWVRFAMSGTDGITAFFRSYMAPFCMVCSSLLLKIISGQESHFALGFMGAVRVSQLWDQWVKKKGLARITPEDYLGMLLIFFGAGVFSFACLIREVETFQGKDPNFFDGSLPAAGDDAPAHERWTLFASIYFMLVQTSKTGYGDLLPRSMLGQLVAFVGTVMTVYLMCTVLLRVLQGLEQTGAVSSGYPYRPYQRHIIITGTPSFQVLKDFLSELYSDDISSEHEDLNTVVLLLSGQRTVFNQLIVYINQPENIRLVSRVWCVEGSALTNEDLDNCRFKTCQAAFVLPNVYTQDPEKEDCGNIMRALAMKRHVPFVRIVGVVMGTESVEPMVSLGLPPSDVVCFDEITHGVMGKAAEVPGFLTVAASLMQSSTNIPAKFVQRDGFKWLDDYASGIAGSMFEVELPTSYYEVPFSQVAVDVAERSDYKAYMIGLSEEPVYPNDHVNYVLFPNKYYRIGTQTDRLVKGIFIAKNPTDIKMAPPGRSIKWSSTTFYESHQAKNAYSNPRHPNSKAAKDKEGWVRPEWLEEQDRAEYVNFRLRATANNRTAQGLMNRGYLGKSAIHDLLDNRNPDLFHDGEELESLLEDTTSELMSDPLERVLLVKQIQIQNEAREEKRSMDEKQADDQDYAETEGISLAMSRIIKFEEGRERQRSMDPIAKEEDDALWGHPSFAPEKPWGAPKEPPPEVLVRGNHIILLSLESDLPGDDPAISEAALQHTRTALRPGRRLDLRTFARSIRVQSKRRHIVVISLRVPYDWASMQKEIPYLSLVRGPPLAKDTLIRAGFFQSRSVVIIRRDVPASPDPSLVDSEACFALRLIESLLLDRNMLHKPVLMQTHLEVNTNLMNETSAPPKEKSLMEILESQKAGEDDDHDTSKNIELQEHIPILVQHRFASGLLFSSNLVTCLAARLLYSPSVAAILGEMNRAPFTVVPIPAGWRGITWRQLYEHLMRKKNLLPMALLRKTNAQESLDFLEGALDARRQANPEDDTNTLYEKVGNVADAMRSMLDKDDQRKWHWFDGTPFERYTLVMPLGMNFIIFHDGVLCMQPTTRTITAKTGEPRSRIDDPTAAELKALQQQKEMKAKIQAQGNSATQDQATKEQSS